MVSNPLSVAWPSKSAAGQKVVVSNRWARYVNEFLQMASIFRHFFRGYIHVYSSLLIDSIVDTAESLLHTTVLITLTYLSARRLLILRIGLLPRGVRDVRGGGVIV